MTAATASARPSTAARLGAEAVGTFALVFAGTGAVAANSLTGALGHVGVALTFGLVIGVMVYAFKDLSGAQYNPAVTIALWTRGDLAGRAVLPYIGAQLAGAILGSGALIAVVGHVEGVDLGATRPAAILAGGGWLAPLAIEALATFLLVTVILGVVRAGDRANPWAGIAIGGTVLLDALAFGTLTGASMNPARSIAPALFVPGALADVWLYLVGPVAGGIVAAGIDRLIRGRAGR